MYSIVELGRSKRSTFSNKYSRFPCCFIESTKYRPGESRQPICRRRFFRSKALRQYCRCIPISTVRGIDVQNAFYSATAACVTLRKIEISDRSLIDVCWRSITFYWSENVSNGKKNQFFPRRVGNYEYETDKHIPRARQALRAAVRSKNRFGLRFPIENRSYIIIDGKRRRPSNYFIYYRYYWRDDTRAHGTTITTAVVAVISIGVRPGNALRGKTS